MKIALTTYALNAGGMEVFILTLASGLVRAGHEVHLVTTDEPGTWFSRASEVGAAAIHINGLSRRSARAHARNVGDYLRDTEYDLIINNHSRSVQTSLGTLRKEVLVISVIHNTPRQLIASACSNEEGCDAIVAPSMAIWDLAERFLRDKRKLTLIPHGVVVPLQHESRPCVAGHLKIVYAGRLEHTQKGVLFLPDIVSETVKEGLKVTLHVVGDGPDRERLEGLVNDRSKEYVIFHGRLSHDDTIQLFRCADVFIMPSYYEGLPFSLLEAMSMSCVPVASLLPGVTDWVVDDGTSGYLVPRGDVHGFSQALARLARNPAERMRMSLAAWKTARERFAVEAMHNSYLGLIDRLRLLPRIREGLPRLAPDLMTWKDRLPGPIRTTVGTLRRALGHRFVAAAPEMSVQDRTAKARRSATDGFFG